MNNNGMNMNNMGNMNNMNNNNNNFNRGMNINNHMNMQNHGKPNQNNQMNNKQNNFNQNINPNNMNIQNNNNNNNNNLNMMNPNMGMIQGNNNNQMNHQMNHQMNNQMNDNNYKKNKMQNFKRKRHHPNLELSIISSVTQESQSIDKNETNLIKNIIQIEYSNSNKTHEFLSEIITEKIKRKLGGEWFIYICEQNQNISFSISTVSDSDFLIIKVGTSLFKIAKVK